MTSAGNKIIQSLNNINNCQGKCSCCQSLQQQINQLKAEIKATPKINEQQLINKAAKQAKEFIEPLLPGLVTPIAIAAIVPKLQPLQIAQQVLKSDVAKARNTAKLGLDLARDASGKVITARNAAEFAAKQAGNASNTASRAITVANNTSGKLATVSSQANRALNVANQGFTKSSQALAEAGNAALQAQAARAASNATKARVAGIVGVLASLTVTVAALKLSELRFDQVEKVTDALSRDLSKALGFIGQNRILIKSNSADIKTNTKDVKEVQTTTQELKFKVRKVEQQAQTATKTATSAQQQAQTATRTATSAQQQAQTATRTATSAQQQAQTATRTATSAQQQAQTATRTATSAQQQAQTAFYKATSNQSQIKGLELEFAEIKPRVKLGLDLARDASGKVITAQNAADFARQQATQAQSTANKALELAQSAKSNPDPATKTKVINITAQQRNFTQQVNQINHRISVELAKDKDNVDAQAQAKLDQILEKVNLIPPMALGIPALQQQVKDLPKALPQSSEFKNGVKQGSCLALKSPDCRSGLSNDIDQAVKKSGATQTAQLAAIQASVAAPISGSTPKEDCTLGTTTQTPYGGIGMYGLQSQINSLSQQIEQIGKIVCRTYRIMGGNSWFSAGNSPKYKFNPEESIKNKIKQAYREQTSPAQDVQPLTIEVQNLPDMLFGLNSAMWRRSGLYKLPVKAPPSILPNITRNPANGEIVSVRDWAPHEYQNITDILSFDAYRLAQMRSVVGEFPFSFKVEVEENGQIVEKNLWVDNISDAFSELTGLALIIQDDLELNTQLGIKGLTETAATKNATLITQDLALANSKYLGYQMTRNTKQVKTLFTPGTSNVKEFLKESDQQIISYAHRSGHLEHKMNTLLISAGITKAALTGRPNDAVPGNIIAKDTLKQLQANEDDWKQFLKLLREPIGDMKIDGVPVMEIEDLTNKLKEALGKLQ